MVRERVQWICVLALVVTWSMAVAATDPRAVQTGTRYQWVGPLKMETLEGSSFPPKTHLQSLTVVPGSDRAFLLGGASLSIVTSKAYNSLYTLDMTLEERLQPLSTGTTAFRWNEYQLLDPHSPPPRFGHTAGFVAGTSSSPAHDEIWSFGGQEPSLFGSTFHPALHALDIERMAWRSVRTIGEAPSERAHHVMATLRLQGDQHFLIGGGVSGKRILNDYYLLNTAQEKWRRLKDAPFSPRKGSAVAVLPDQTLFLFGGEGEGRFYNDLYEYDSHLDSWKIVSFPKNTVLPPPRAYHSLVHDADRNALFLYGGADSEVFSDFWAFNITTRVWSQINVKKMDQTVLSRKGHSLIRLQNRLYLYGGSDVHQHNELYRLDQIFPNDIHHPHAHVHPATSPSLLKKPTISLLGEPKIVIDLGHHREWVDPGFKVLGCDAPCPHTVSLLPERLPSPLRTGIYKIVYLLSPIADPGKVIDSITRFVEVVAGVRSTDSKKLRQELDDIRQRISSVPFSSIDKRHSPEEDEALKQLETNDQKLQTLRQKIHEIEENIKRLQQVRDQVRAQEAIVLEIQSKREEFVSLVNLREHQVSSLSELHHSVTNELQSAQSLLYELETIEAQIEYLHGNLSSIASFSSPPSSHTSTAVFPHSSLETPGTCDTTEALHRREIELINNRIGRINGSLHGIDQEEKTLHEEINRAQATIDRENALIQKHADDTAATRRAIADLEARITASNAHIQKLVEEGHTFGETRAHLDQLHSILKSSTWTNLEKAMDSASQLEDQAARLLLQLSEKAARQESANAQEIEEKKTELMAKNQKLYSVTDALEADYHNEYREWNNRLAHERKEKNEMLAEMSKLIEKLNGVDRDVENHRKLASQTQSLHQARSSALLNVRQRHTDAQNELARERIALKEEQRKFDDVIVRCETIREQINVQKERRTVLLAELSELQTQHKNIADRLGNSLSHLEVQSSKLPAQLHTLASSRKSIDDKVALFRSLQKREHTIEI